MLKGGLFLAPGPRAVHFKEWIALFTVALIALVEPMNFSQLEAFVTTCRLHSYTRAAEQLYISQPALHHKVKQLEAELGATLLVVQNRQVVPTIEGEHVLAVAERVLTELHALEQHFKLKAEQRSVRVGATSQLAAISLPSAVAAFRDERPDVQVYIVSLDPNELYDALISNRVDFAVAYKEYVTTDMEIEPLPGSEMVVVASAMHPLADGKVHQPHELLAYPWALTEKGMGMRTKIEAWFREVVGVGECPVEFEARSGALLAQMALSSSEVVTFLSKPSMAQFRLEQIRVEGFNVPSQPVICYLPGQKRRRIVDQFIGILRACADEQAQALASAR
jgi:DNA-binding transcriptional LysR family regulator